MSRNSCEIDEPLTIGIVRPILLLPFSQNSKEQRNAVFVEENVSEEDIENNKSFMSQFTIPAVTEIPEDAYFQDEMGNIYEMEYQNLEKGCAHIYINGSFSEHVRIGNGCTLTLYKAQKCSKCGYVLKGEFETSSKYATCPH